jgi:hypothetical protein
VDAAALGRPDRLCATLDVGDAGAGEAADRALGDDLGDYRIPTQLVQKSLDFKVSSQTGLGSGG